MNILNTVLTPAEIFSAIRVQTTTVDRMEFFSKRYDALLSLENRTRYIAQSLVNAPNPPSLQQACDIIAAAKAKP